MIELLCLITNTNNDKKLKEIEKKYALSFNLTTYGKGTASSSLLNYFGLEEIKKYIYFSIISINNKKEMLKDIKETLKLEKYGNGILFTIPISSSTKYIQDKINNKETNMEKTKTEKENKEKTYELIITIVNEGYSDIVMEAAKKKGANGGTLLKGRSMLENTKKNKFMGITIEPEKDIVLSVIDSNNKKEIMNFIIEKAGLKTKGNGIIFSIPIDDAIGLYE